MLNLKYGNGVVTLNVRGTASLEKLLLPPLEPLANVGQAFADAASYGCFGTLGLNALASAGDQFTILLRENHRIHMDHIVSMLTYYLYSLGIPYENMALLVAGTSAAGILPPDLAGKLTVTVHDCDSPGLVSFGTTAHGIPVTAHPLLRDRKIIVVGETRRDPLTGFSGGPECLIYACGRATIEGCFNLGRSGGGLASGVQPGNIVGNPICEEMTGAARLISPLFAIYPIADAQGRFCRFICGGWLEAWYESCNVVQQCFGVPVPGPGDIVAASCGGYPYDATWRAACRSLFHAAQTVREGGVIILAAECREGGPDAFLSGENLSGGDALLYLGFQSLVQKYRVLVQSKIHTQFLAKFGMEGFRTMETLEARVDFKDQVIRFLPFADIAAPYRI